MFLCSHLRSAIASLAILTIATACGGKDQARPDLHPASIRLLSGGGTTADTIDAIEGPLVVEVRNSAGAPVAGAAIEFAVYEPEMTLHYAFISAGTGQAYCCGYHFDEISDAAGQAAVRVGLGPRPQTFKVFIGVRGTALRDSATFVVQHGAVASLSVSHDTAIFVDRSFQVTGMARDRHDNPVPDAPSYTGIGDAITADAAGRVLARRYGVGAVDVTVGSVTKRVAVNVIPEGRLLAGWGEAGVASVFLANTDGSERRRIPGTEAQEPSLSVGQQWAPDGNHFVFRKDARLYRADSTGNVTRAVPDDVGLWEEDDGVYSPDGQFIYFVGKRGILAREIWRVRADGTEAMRIGPVASAYDVDARPSPSPDGTSLLFSSNRPGFALASLDLTTGTMTSIPARSFWAAWSPRGDMIAVLDSLQFISLIRPDGTVIRNIGNLAGDHYGPFNWSPDGRWLITHRDVVFELIDTETGVAIPIPQAGPDSRAAWRP